MLLYHYTNFDGLVGILKSKKIWLVSSREMSDLTDRFYGNLFASIALLKGTDSDIELLRNHLTDKDIIEINMETFDVDFFSTSFCTRKDNNYLWNNYSNSNKGVCIEIDFEILREYMNFTLVDKYEKLDEEDNITELDKDILIPRKVEYDYPIELFTRVIKSTKKMAISEEDLLSNEESSKIYFKNWFLYSLIIMAGVVKASKFSDEEETRLLFKNYYNDDFINEHMIYALEKARLSKVFEALGLDNEIIDNKKRRLELNINGAFSSKLIPSIIVGDEFDFSINELKKIMINAGLSNTVILDRKGEKI